MWVSKFQNKTQTTLEFHAFVIHVKCFLTTRVQIFQTAVISIFILFFKTQTNLVCRSKSSKLDIYAFVIHVKRISVDSHYARLNFPNIVFHIQTLLALWTPKIQTWLLVNHMSTNSCSAGLSYGMKCPTTSRKRNLKKF